MSYDPEYKVKRSLEMCAMYKDGITLQEIGDKYGITRERVRQLISAYGLTGADGCVQKKVKERKKAAASIRRKKLDEAAIKSFGVDHAGRVAIGGNKVMGGLAQKYRDQWRSARHRCIAWNFTLPEWVEVWEASGKMGERGAGGDAYVLSRKDFTGPFSRDNALIETLSSCITRARHFYK